MTCKEAFDKCKRKGDLMGMKAAIMAMVGEYAQNGKSEWVAAISAMLLSSMDRLSVEHAGNFLDGDPETEEQVFKANERLYNKMCELWPQDKDPWEHGEVSDFIN